MPELPEVETYKRYLDKTSLNKIISSVQINDERILKMEKDDFSKILIGKKFDNSIRHGKYLFANLQSHFLIFHFGMSGDLEYFEASERAPEYTKALFKFDNGYNLSYISIRMFGWLNIVKNMEQYIQDKGLGPDAFKMDYGEFEATLKGRSAYLKSLLLNQNVFAGIGNIYSDEILFQACLHPKRKVNDLDEVELKLLFKKIKEVLEFGIKKKGDLSSYPDNFLIPHRRDDQKCPNCSTELKRISISSRNGYYCPTCQK